MGKTQQKRIKNADMKYLGTEPTTVESPLEYLQALNWYNHFYDVSKAKKWLQEYCGNNDLSLKDAREINMTMCSIARMLNRGLDIDKSHIEYLHSKVDDKITSPARKTDVLPVGCHFSFPLDDFEEVLDDFYRGNYKYFDPGVYRMLVEKKARPIDGKTVADYYRELLLDLDMTGYEYLGKRKLSAYRKFIQKMVDDANTYSSNQRKPRKPRQKKIKSAAALVAKLKYKLLDNDLRVTSIAPEKIVGAELVYVYDTKYRQLTKLVSEDCTSMTVRGTTIVSIDFKKSESKILRKPDEFLQKFMTSGKLAKRRAFDGLKTKSNEANGRMNGCKLILGAY